ncbi:hypothetical protein AURDEDRAFT_127233 [Auricularia subglabra TFB-10046 SS5]|nr:hypothetical protein AURDEDRAFT_127233 [Auricularia subglabra TFB-10046 SS5]
MPRPSTALFLLKRLKRFMHTSVPIECPNAMNVTAKIQDKETPHARRVGVHGSPKLDNVKAKIQGAASRVRRASRATTSRPRSKAPRLEFDARRARQRQGEGSGQVPPSALGASACRRQGENPRHSASRSTRVARDNVKAKIQETCRLALYESRATTSRRRSNTPRPEFDARRARQRQGQDPGDLPPRALRVARDNVKAKIQGHSASRATTSRRRSKGIPPRARQRQGEDPRAFRLARDNVKAKIQDIARPRTAAPPAIDNVKAKIQSATRRGIDGHGVKVPGPSRVRSANHEAHYKSMQLRALAHRSKTLSLRRQMDDVSGSRVFTTLATKARENVGDAVELDNGDEEDEALPAIVEQDTVREARLSGELSDCTEPDDHGPTAASPLWSAASPCSEWSSEGKDKPCLPRRRADGAAEEYPMEVRVLSRPLSQVLRDAEEWQRAKASSPSEPASPPAAALPKKKTRRGGRANKPRAKWTEAQRRAEKESVAYANRTALLRAMRQNERLLERRDAPPPVSGKHLANAEQYSSSFKVADVGSNRSPFVAARLAPRGKSGTTSPVYRNGFSRVGISAASRTNIRWVLRQALGPPEGCNDYVLNLVKNQGFTYVPSSSYAQVFTDKDGLIYAVKVPQPAGDQWPGTVKYFTEYLHKLRADLKISHAANTNHARGDFVRITWGTSHGGGRKVRTLPRPRTKS